MPTSESLRATWPARILVADDEPVARKLLRRVLEPAGYEVLESASGKEATSSRMSSVEQAIELGSSPAQRHLDVGIQAGGHALKRVEADTGQPAPFYPRNGRLTDPRPGRDLGLAQSKSQAYCSQ